MTVSFTVPGKPMGKERPRFSRHGGTYTPQKTKDYEEKVRLCCLQENGRKYFDKNKQLDILISAYFEPPKKVTKRFRKLMLNGTLPPICKSDIDNIAKIILDALNGFLYYDDSQIVDLRVLKRYSENPEVFVEVKEYEGWWIGNEIV